MQWHVILILEEITFTQTTTIDIQVLIENLSFVAIDCCWYQMLLHWVNEVMQVHAYSFLDG